eukprot:Gb_27635 [translate_table: standard]
MEDKEVAVKNDRIIIDISKANGILDISDPSHHSPSLVVFHPVLSSFIYALFCTILDYWQSCIAICLPLYLSFNSHSPTPRPAKKKGGQQGNEAFPVTWRDAKWLETHGKHSPTSMKLLLVSKPPNIVVIQFCEKQLLTLESRDILRPIRTRNRADLQNGGYLAIGAIDIFLWVVMLTGGLTDFQR